MRIPEVKWQKKTDIDSWGTRNISYYGIINESVIIYISKCNYERPNLKYRLEIFLPTKMKMLGNKRELDFPVCQSIYHFKSVKKCKEMAQEYIKTWLEEFTRG